MFTESSSISVSKTPEVAVRSEQAAEVRPEAKAQDASQTNSNATSVSISTDAQQLANLATLTKAAEVEQPKVAQKKEDTAEKLSKRLEQALNNVAGTKVSFGVETVAQEDTGDINFRVVDKDTGETVREFPPESLYSFEKALASDSSTGLLVDVVS